MGIPIVFTRAAVIAALIFSGAAVARADDASVTAVLSSSETFVGQPVQLQIKLTGARGATMPDSIAVDGLDIRYTGESTMMEARNFQFSYSVVYSFTIMPLKGGTFKIPPQSVRVGAKVLKTPELTLNVSDTSGRNAQRGGRSGNNTAIDPSQIAFIELVVGKTNAYVGEMIPAEVRIGFNTRTPVESLGGGIDLSGQGFTTQKIRDPRQTIEQVRGHTYQMFIFKTAISPVRSGKIDIGPIEATPTVRVPQMNRNRSQMRDPFNMSDPFFDQFFNDPFFAPAAPRQISLKSEVVSLDVKPLPPDAPPNFTGAVGTFTMSNEAKPKAAQVGDPITVTAKITGRGNFDRVSAPVLEDENGWHKYPPSSQFKQDDDVGISGTKTFDSVISANEHKDKIPPLVFAFFDPVKEQYVTLRSTSVPVKIEGASIATPAPAQTAAPAASSSPSATATPTAKPQDILYQMNEMPARVEVFTPVYARREFWLAQLFPLAALAGYVGWKLRQRRRSNREAQRIAALQHELTQIERKLHRDDVDASEFFVGATRAVQLKTAMAQRISPNVIDAETAANAFQLEASSRERLRWLFAQRDELRYSGSGGGNTLTAISTETRREVNELLRELHR